MSSSSRCTTPLMPGRIVIAYDATKDRNGQEFKDMISNILKRDRLIQEVDTITVLGVLHKVLHPMGFQIQIGADSFMGTHIRAIKEEVSKKVDAYVCMLRHNAEECGEYGVNVEVKIVVGAPIKKVVAYEVAASNATWVVLDRHLRKDLRFYLKHIPCKVALVLDNLSLEVFRPYYSDKTIDIIENKLLYSLSKIVPLSPSEYNENDEQSVMSSSYRASTSSQASSDSDKSSLVSLLTSKSKDHSIFSPDEFGSNPQLEKSDQKGGNTKVENKYENSPPLKQKQRSPRNYSDVSIISTPRETKSALDSELYVTTTEISSGGNSNIESKFVDLFPVNVMQKQISLVTGSPDTPVHLPANEVKMGYSCSEVQIATNYFASYNLLGEGGYGDVYKGQLEDGQLIAVKVQNEANIQAFAELHSDVRDLHFARHRNIVTLLGYCFKENLSVLVFEFVCNKSLEWHLFENKICVLEWHQRQAISIGTAKALHFLHEECQGSPIIHQDIKPSNILLTHDFVPLLGNCGLAKWKSNKFQQLLCTNAYCAPECAESRTYSVKTDVFAFGNVLIQLISGRKAVDSTSDNNKRSLIQWALPLIQNLAFDELVDPRLGDLYSTYEIYQMARTAHLCVQSKPEMRPTMGEVLHLLEGKNDNLCHLTEQFTSRHGYIQNTVQALLVE